MEKYMFDWKEHTYSKSSIGTLLNCPKSFKLSYIDKKPQKANKWAVKGIEIHSWLDKLNKQKLCVNEIPDKYKSHILNYTNFLKQYKLQLPNYSEYRLNSVVQDLKFTGIVDAIFIDKDKGFVLDYKTGKGSYNIGEYRFELQLYSLLAERTLNIEIHTYGILFTGNGVFLYEKNDHKYFEVEESIRKSKKLLQDKELGAIPDIFRCSICFFNSFCEECKKIII
jgi:RecB family exonuclease